MRHLAAGGLDAESRETLISAADACLVFDPQCEGLRSEWLAEMLGEAGLVGEAVERIRGAGEGRPWDAEHRYGLLLALARRGGSGAAELLRSMWEHDSVARWMDEAPRIVELDGAEGLIRVARRIGRHLEGCSEHTVAGWFLCVFDEREGEGAARRLLEAESATDAEIARFLVALDLTAREEAARIEASKTERARKKRMSAREMIEWVRSDPEDRGFWLRSWGRAVSEEAQREVWDAMLEESEPGRIERFLRVFGGVEPPEFHERLAAWRGREELGWRVGPVLERVRDPRVRALALEDLARPEPRLQGIALLNLNFEEGDVPLLERVLDKLESAFKDQDVEHWALMDILKVLEANPGPANAGLLTRVYEATPCSNCRGDAFIALDRLGLVPPWMREEALLDSDEDIRARAAADGRDSGE